MRLMEADGENGIQEQPYERRLTFLYATQTGNAQDLAESLARHAIRQHFETQCLSMGDYNPVQPPSTVVLTLDGSR
jgi:sulfite reductase alpha subunit-like flavoprotein